MDCDAHNEVLWDISVDDGLVRNDIPEKLVWGRAYKAKRVRHTVLRTVPRSPPSSQGFKIPKFSFLGHLHKYLKDNLLRSGHLGT